MFFNKVCLKLIIIIYRERDRQRDRDRESLQTSLTKRIVKDENGYKIKLKEHAYNMLKMPQHELPPSFLTEKSFLSNSLDNTI